MPKARQTCTRCSMRRQKCDCKDPCTRCVQSNVASSFTRKWPHDYDPKVHRSYPRNKDLQPRLQALPQDDARDASHGRNVTTIENVVVTNAPFSSQTTFQSQGFNPLESVLTNEILKPYDSDQTNFQPSRKPNAGSSSPRSHPEVGRAEICPRTMERNYLQTLMP